MKQKKNYWTYCKDCSPFWIYCKDCDEYHTFEEVPCYKELHRDAGIWDIENFVLPALPKDERGPPLWTPDMKGTSMELVLAMQLEKQKRKRKAEGRIDWRIMNAISPGNLEEWV